MKAIILHKDHSVLENNLTRSDLLQAFPYLKHRDLRPVFAPLQVATILPRFETLIINFGFAKAVLSKELVYFLVHGDKTDHVQVIIDRIIQKTKPVEGQTVAPFYLVVLEKILEEKVSQLGQKVDNYERWSADVLDRITKRFEDKTLEDLLRLRKKISRMETRLEEIRAATDEILADEDEFYQLINVGDDLSIDRGEAESILEDFLEQIEDLAGQIKNLKENIEDTQDYLSLRFDNTRNKIIKFDLMATMITLVFSFLAVVVGLYGVNITSGLENDLDAFMRLRNIVLGGAILSMLALLVYFNNRKVF